MIAGYRTLSSDEIGLINSLKTLLGTRVLESLSEVRMHVTRQRVACRKIDDPASDAIAATELKRIDDAQPERWIAVANTHFQQGLMALVRAVAQPEGF